MTTDLKRFWLRRAKRLLPALFTMLIVTCAYAAAFVPDALYRLRTRHGRRRHLLHQLVVDRQQPELLRGPRPSPAAAPPLVARRRGAVVPALAVGVRGGHRPRAGPRRALGGAGAARRAGVDRVDGRRLRSRRRRLPRLLRHGHPHLGAADRGRDGDGVDAVAVAAGQPLAPARPRRRRLGLTRAARVRDAAVGRGRHLPLPRRVPRRRAAVDRRRGDLGPPRARRPSAPPSRCRSCAGSARAATGCTCGTGRCSW